MKGGTARPGSATAWALSGTAWLVYAFFYAPIVLLVLFSFSDDRNVGRWGGFTLSWYEQFIDHSQLQNSLWVSIRVALLSTAISVVLGTLLSGMNEQLEEAALDLYANRWRSFRYVTLPQIAPGIAGGALLALTLSLDDVVVTQFASGPGSTTLPVFVFGMIRRGVTPLINAVSVIMLAASIVLVILSLVTQRLRTDGSGRSLGDRLRKRSDSSLAG